MEIQYNPLKKYPKPKNQPIKKKYLLLSLNSFPTFRTYKRIEKVKKFIKVKLYGETLKEVKKPKIKGIKKNIKFLFLNV